MVYAFDFFLVIIGKRMKAISVREAKTNVKIGGTNERVNETLVGVVKP